MSRRINESARVLNFFKQADLSKAEVLYDLVRETMDQRLAPVKAAKKAQAKKRKMEQPVSQQQAAQQATPTGKMHVADRGDGGASQG
jgi:hypothetical protein